MIYLNFEDFINEKLGIHDDVIILSDFLYNILKKNKKEKIVIKDNIPEVSFKISKIIINFHSSNDVNAYFNERFTTLKDNGFEIYLSFNKNIELKKRAISHELSHLIDHEIKLSKRIKEFKDVLLSSKFANIFNNKKFNNLCYLIYLSDEGEIKAHVHQFYEIFQESFDDIKFDDKNYDKNKIFEFLLDETGVKKLYTKMINYNIFEDLKSIPDKLKLKFFNDFLNINKNIYNIKKTPSLSTIKMIFHLLFGKKNDLNLEDFMFKTQKHINERGIILRDKIHKLYGLF